MAEKSNNKTQPAVEEQRRERAVLVSVVREGQEVRQAEEYLDELEFLAETADIESVRRFMQRLPQPSARRSCIIAGVGVALTAKYSR